MDWIFEEAKQAQAGFSPIAVSPTATRWISAEINRGLDIIDLVFRLTSNKGFISGGFARYAISRKDNPEMPGDIDIFTRNMDEFSNIRTAFGNVEKMKRKSESDMEVKYEYTLSSGFHSNVYNIQLIKPLNIARMVSGGSIEDVLENFDFTIAKSAIKPGIMGSPTAVCHPDFHVHDLESTLVITNIHCPISSMKRVIKYTQRGFKIDNKELLKLFVDYENRPQDWKNLVHRGINNPQGMSASERQSFARGMYMD